ncbi:DNA-processing protein DprA [Alphaproteobacteria bacterium endosymbiont of Tiliacea citrago]|uniref:DNA-processing protein DprA n=1 Tax=Alphaproteobacteria bacterium endosymbiont of Tiliacea citrago TaxID=3077944 RepID=UPI00313DD119
MLSEEKIAQLRLLKTPKIGRVTFFHLLKTFKTAIEAIYGLNDYLKQIGKKTQYSISSKESVLTFIDNCQKSNVKLIFFSDDQYPKEFLMASDYPPILYCKGNVNLLNNECLAVVGSRSASLQGISFTKKLIKDLNNITIVSGFAKGIDTAAHEASLSFGTIAVLGSGINIIYPEENKILYSKILEQNGLIVSEIGLNDSPKPNFFAYRNRLISGIAKGVLVVEAAINSGSLITAKYALEQGKNIFAVPGHPFDIRSYGTNYLIKNGAILVRNSDDILSEFNNYSNNTNFNGMFSVAEENLDEVKNYILTNLRCDVSISISEIIALSNYSVASINAALAELELCDLVSIQYNLVQKF